MTATEAPAVATDGKTYPDAYMRPCGVCGATPTRRFMNGPACEKHTPAALAGHPETRPDPDLTMAGLRKARGEDTPPPLPPASDSRLHDDRATVSGKRRSSPQQYREARSRVEATR